MAPETFRVSITVPPNSSIPLQRRVTFALDTGIQFGLFLPVGSFSTPALGRLQVRGH
jgi:hypothetical protein